MFNSFSKRPKKRENTQEKAFLYREIAFVRSKLSWFLESKVYGLLFAVAGISGAIAQFPQLLNLLLDSSIEGVTLEEYAVLIFAYGIITLHGIERIDWRIVVFPGIGLIEVIWIFSIVWARGGEFIFF